MKQPHKVVLIIMDGWGIGAGDRTDAVAAADTPFIDSLYRTAPHATLLTDGVHVGLPPGQMGNSEVGHLNIGAGRVVYQDLMRVNNAIAHGSLERNPVLQQAFAEARIPGRRLHLMGLLSDGGVHAMRVHAEALCHMAHRAGVKELFVHAFTDGRDADPRSGLGYGSVVVFLPQIVILFAFILALEASGYMAPATFLMDQLMLRVGLNGRAFIPLLSSFACAIRGMMSARTIENENDRLTTILVAPLMTCSARLAVYTLIIAAFIPATKVGPFGLLGLVMFALYGAGVLSALLVAFILKRTVTKGPPQALLMELPTYKLPDLQDFLINLASRAWAFLRRAGGMIFAVTVVLWFLSSFPASAEGIRDSYAGIIGSWLEPLLRPIGFNLEIAIALVPGMAAREVAVAALGTVYSLRRPS